MAAQASDPRAQAAPDEDGPEERVRPLTPREARREYAALLEEARSLIGLGQGASELRPRLRELIAQLQESGDELRRLEDELREVHRRAYHLETCLEDADEGTAGVLPEPFPSEGQQLGARSRPSELSD